MEMRRRESTRVKISRKDLIKQGLLGSGGFATVELYEHKVTKATYAMKCISKGFIMKLGMKDAILNEKVMMLMTNSLFLIKLWECYNGRQTVCFLLEAALGGEIYATYNRKGLHGSEPHAKFYVAGVLCGFDHMHERRIIYRDLKPENLLLNSHGFLKIADMGLAKFAIGNTYTTCGTPDYFAPELIQSEGHNKGVDWWTLGILMFELMSGHTPFEAPFPMKIYARVLKGINHVSFPAKCQGAVGDLVKALLKTDPADRLAMRPGGSKNIKDHKWYSGFNWELFALCKLPPPYVPTVRHNRDFSNFSANPDDRPMWLPFVDDGSGWDREFATIDS